MTRLYIDVGRDDGVRPGDIVGAIANEAGIPGSAIGAIEQYERFSFVEVPSNEADSVMRALKRSTIRGKKVSPSIARPDTRSGDRPKSNRRPDRRSDGKSQRRPRRD